MPPVEITQFYFTRTIDKRKLLYTKELSSKAANSQPNEQSTAKFLPGESHVQKTKEVRVELASRQSANRRRVCNR